MDRESLPILRTTERKDFKRCPQRWFWAWRQGLKPKKTSIPLWFGTGFHLALAHYYDKGTKRNLDFIDVWRDFVDNDPMSNVVRTVNGENEKPEYVNARELGEAMLLGYHRYWGGDPHWDVVETEQDFQVNIPDANGDPILIFASTFDGVYRDKVDKKFKLMEHKTAAQIAMGHLPIDDQAGGYWAVANSVLRHKGILGKGEFIRAITYNFAKKKMPDERPTDEQGYALNKDGSRSKQQPTPLFERKEIPRTRKEQATQIKRIGAEAQAMRAMKEKQIPLFKTPTKDCSWDCDFYHMCMLHEQDSDWKEYRDAMYIVQDPYINHRKAA